MGLLYYQLVDKTGNLAEQNINIYFVDHHALFFSMYSLCSAHYISQWVCFVSQNLPQTLKRSSPLSSFLPLPTHVKDFFSSLDPIPSVNLDTIALIDYYVLVILMYICSIHTICPSIDHYVLFILMYIKGCPKKTFGRKLLISQKLLSL